MIMITLLKRLALRLSLLWKARTGYRPRKCFHGIVVVEGKVIYCGVCGERLE